MFDRYGDVACSGRRVDLISCWLDDICCAGRYTNEYPMRGTDEIATCGRRKG